MTLWLQVVPGLLKRLAVHLHPDDLADQDYQMGQYLHWIHWDQMTQKDQLAQEILFDLLLQDLLCLQMVPMALHLLADRLVQQVPEGQHFLNSQLAPADLMALGNQEAQLALAVQ